MKSILSCSSSRYSVLALALAVCCLGQAASGATGMGTAFTYQGRLMVGTNACNGLYDLGFTLRDAATGGNPVGAALTSNAVAVSNGLFMVTLDFGAGVFGGDARWLEISVRTNGGGAFSTLSPRPCVSPTPYALAAGNLVGALPAHQLSGIYSNAVSFNNPASSFAGNGAGLTNVSAVSLGGLGASAFWQLNGNACTTAGANFVGTSDNQPLELKANGQRILRLEPVGPNRTYPNLIAGDAGNSIATNVAGSVIAGGNSNSILGNMYISGYAALFATLGGGSSNLISGWVESCTIGGGSGNTVSAIEDATMNWSTISGGRGNSVTASHGGGSDSSTISGGLSNVVFWVQYASIGGGRENQIRGPGGYSTISGGHSNVIDGWGTGSATIGGGQQNAITDMASETVIAGGYGNTIGGLAGWSSIAGGTGNTIGGNTKGSCIGGGLGNTIEGNECSGSTIAGGQTNTVTGSYAMIPGGQYNFATNNAFAAGFHASAQYPGSFVWADASSASTFAASAANQVSFRCSGGVRFGSGTSGGNQQVAWTPGGAGWSFSSDRDLKERFTEVEPRAVLEKVSQLPLSEWSYKQHEQRHIGPTAQDFHALFPLNENDKMIDDADLHGVELAAIQGLNHKVETDNAALRAENAELRARLEKLEQLISALKGGGK